MTLEIAPDVARQVQENAAREGMSESDYLARLMHQSSAPLSEENFAVAPADPAARVRALLAKWQEEDGTALRPTVSAKTLFAQADAEYEAMTEEEQAEEDRVWDGFIESLNEVRAAQGMRLL